jgi:hypothetical protein
MYNFIGLYEREINSSAVKMRVALFTFDGDSNYRGASLIVTVASEPETVRGPEEPVE